MVNCSQQTLAKAVEAGVLKGKLTAIIDTSPVHGAGAVADTYELIRGFLRKVVRTAGGRLDDAARAAAEPFCGVKPDIDWQDPTARKAHLGELITAARRVLAGAAGIDDDAVAEPAGLLRQVIGQDVELDDDFQPQIRDGVAADRVISHSDPEMRHGRKSASRRFDGHKLDVITDEESELILGVDVRAGNASDGDGAAPMLEEVQDVDGVEVETLLGDMAYSDGDVREAVEAAGAEMVAKVPPVSNAGRFPKTDFNVDTRAGSVTCPAGHTTFDARPTKDHKRRPATLYVFPADMCAGCPLREQCTTATAGRTIVVGRHHDRIEAARAAQAEPATKHCCAAARRWNARSITSKTSACARPATADGDEPSCKRCLQRQSPTSSGSSSSTRSRSPPPSPHEHGEGPPDRQFAVVTPIQPSPTPSPPPHPSASTMTATPTTQRHRLKTGTCCYHDLCREDCR